MTGTRLGRIVIAFAAALCAAIAIIILADVWSGDRRETLVVTGADVGGPFTLEGPTGAAVTEKSWPGKYLLIYFGYTYCPDVCPTELAAMGNALDKMGDGVADRVQPLFITVDPERDTPEVMSGYAPLFHPRMIGLTGSDAQIAAAAAAFKVIYRKREAQGSSPYLMDHSSFLYLVGPDGKAAAILPPQMTPEAIAEQVEAVMDGA